MEKATEILLALSFLVFFAAAYVEMDHFTYSFDNMSLEQVKFKKKRIKHYKSNLVLAFITILCLIAYVVLTRCLLYKDHTLFVNSLGITVVIMLASSYRLFVACLLHNASQ